MKIPEENSSNWLVRRVLYFQIRGDLDITTIEKTAREYPVDLLPDADALMIDLSAITFLDCSGLRQVMEICRRAQCSGRPVAIVTGGNPSVHRITTALSLDNRLPMYRDYACGIDALVANKY